jgi:DNA-binding LacI/PurR family transcriptional regulator
MSVVKIAKLAGVSVATVSRVINNSSRVKPKTAEQVRKAVAQLGLTGAGVRRGPRRHKTKKLDIEKLAILTMGQAHFQWFQLPVMAAVVSGIMGEAKANHIGVQIEDALGPEQSAEALKDQNVQGALIFLPAGSDAKAMENIARHIPSVRVMGESLTLSAVDHVCPDNVAIGHLALRYLLEHGCKETAFLSAHPHWEFVRSRAFGFQSAAFAADLASPGIFIVSQEKSLKDYYGMPAKSAGTIEELVDMYVNSSKRPSGLFVPRDEETTLVYRLLEQRGMKPGKDVTVVSCDNEAIRLSGLDPRPASIDIRPMEIGRRAVRQLLSRISHPDDPPMRLQVAPALDEKS